MNIKRTKTSNGTKSVLTYWHRGQRYRLTLGYNLSREAEWNQIQHAIEEVHAITKHHDFGARTTLTEFAPEYLRFIEAKGVVDVRRQRSALTLHLLPHLGFLALVEVTLSNGLRYIEDRRVDEAANGTIERELSVLTALLNLAVDYDLLDKNRLKRLPIPKYTKRERVASPDEIKRLKEKAGQEFGALLTLALNTGLRLSLLLRIEAMWIVNGWIILPVPRSSKKSNPLRMPLNTTARSALRNAPRFGRIFANWKDADSVKKRWTRLCRLSGIVDLHFHDLRHTFATRLQNVGVDYEVRAALLGHAVKGATTLYSHGGPEWDKKLKAAVDALERKVPVEVPLADSETV